MMIFHYKHCLRTILTTLTLLVIVWGHQQAIASTASCYGDNTDGFLWGTTANGQVVKPETVGAASNRLPLNSVWNVKYKNRTLIVKVIDRGGYHTMDLTWGTVKRFGFATCKLWGIKQVSIWKHKGR